MDKIYRTIFNYINTLEIIDTHEHLPQWEENRDTDTDFLKEYTSQYINHDLISAGLSKEKYKKIINTEFSLRERWIEVEPYWVAVKNTGYGRSITITVSDLYGYDNISVATIEDINKKFKRTLQPGQYNRILKEKCNIKLAINDNTPDCDKSYFRTTFRLDNFVSPKNFAEIRKIEKRTKIKILCFTDWLEACSISLEKAIKAGAVCLKSALAYERTLKYERTTYYEAEKEFNKVYSKKNTTWNFRSGVLNFDKKFQDYMMHYIFRLANKKRLTFQIHTGLQAGNGNFINNSNPSLLSNIFFEYPDIKFDIFHIGYPYQQILSALAKNFPNVYIDMCWAHVISPRASINALSEWLDSVPCNKIMAFGGDSSIIDSVYGNLYLAKENVCKVLSRKVKEGNFDIKRAKEISEMLFYKNPSQLFGLDIGRKRL